MRNFLRVLLPISLVVLTSGCHFEPPKPVLPDGLLRVPINRVPPVPATSASSALPDAPVGGGGR
ncbi:hypothetical protein C9I57_18590 [Trinickia symbiotica]|uniref:Lipoprotein n=1 Tax=Trinickia symbiotica TaxID=863227 RepID=A0A2T3XRH1_9BURK|nr:hypothetical protein C9I57_18590 [Trinickia symbiotica]